MKDSSKIIIKDKPDILNIDLNEYGLFLLEIKNKIIESRIQASKAVNRALISLYWYIGKTIVEKQELLGWGKSVVEMLSKDLKISFPEMSGFSPQNLWLASVTILKKPYYII
ncbi:MAG TPA: DUF1016 N-terminal domain-containing protein [Candidatus Kapabacteria bacterium]|nr:DUF1016 N-terminal domain-containing protein [Candidatus Kapabacteria bacterium]HPO64173.1 DUF1016 N-terminal domain-containing protein [Candidatus Kapabacteria bacterium]